MPETVPVTLYIASATAKATKDVIMQLVPRTGERVCLSDNYLVRSHEIVEVTHYIDGRPPLVMLSGEKLPATFVERLIDFSHWKRGE